jgi:alpha-D-ribose 1-methylphosphonate 5-triphosphate diphosphatase PhnM
VTLSNLMEDRTNPPSTTWASRDEFATLPTRAQNVSGDAFVDASEIKNENQSSDAQPAKTESGDRGAHETIAFKSEDDNYTWPFELCRSYDVRKRKICLGQRTKECR